MDEGTSQGTLDPSTASKTQSIWRGVNRAGLEKHAHELDRREHVTGRRYYPERPRCTGDEAYPVPFGIEKSLADDFAFIAACQPTALYVSAAVVEQKVDIPALAIRLAANAGVAPDVQKAFDKLVGILRKHPNRGFEPGHYEKQIYDLIIQLNQNRILGRLASRKFQPPAHIKSQKKTRDPLPARVRRLCERNNFGRISQRQSPDLGMLDGQVDKFEAAFQELERSEPSNTNSSLKTTIDCAFALSVDGTKFPRRLQDLGYLRSLLDGRDVRDVGKVANYRRIAHYLAVCSQKFRTYFANIEWYAQPSYKEASTSSIVSRQFVHAEIQLMIHYELCLLPLKPRAIGVSKEACFLCDSFIRAHARFAITGAHRQVFEEWTVPDLREYQLETVQHFRSVLQQVFYEIRQECTKAKTSNRNGPQPLQSAINLNYTRLSTPSPSTLLAPSEVCGSVDTTIASRERVTISSTALQMQPGPVFQEARELDSSHQKRIDTPWLIPEVQTQNVSSDLCPSEAPVEIETDETVAQCADWVEISASLVKAPIDQGITSRQQRFARASITLRSVLESTEHRVVHLTDISADHEMRIERSVDDPQDEMSFTIIGPLEHKVQICCRWEVC